MSRRCGVGASVLTGGGGVGNSLVSTFGGGGVSTCRALLEGIPSCVWEGALAVLGCGRYRGFRRRRVLCVFRHLVAMLDVFIQKAFDMMPTVRKGRWVGCAVGVCGAWRFVDGGGKRERPDVWWARQKMIAPKK